MFRQSYLNGRTVAQLRIHPPYGGNKIAHPLGILDPFTRFNAGRHIDCRRSDMPYRLGNITGIETTSKYQWPSQAWRNQRPVKTLTPTTIALDECIQQNCLG